MKDTSNLARIHVMVGELRFGANMIHALAHDGLFLSA
jgi:hypothetical protein